jgi:hypothetical protein
MGQKSMSTTNLFIELLIIGYMSCVWLAMLLAALFGVPPTDTLLNFLDKAQLLITIVLTSFAYFLGVLVDRLADTALGRWDESVQKRVCQHDEPSILEMQAALFVQAPESVGRFSYQQNRLRVVRAAVFNIGLLIICFLLFIILQPSHRPSSAGGWTIGALGVAIWIATVFTYFRVTLSYWQRTRREYLALSVKQMVGEKPSAGAGA